MSMSERIEKQIVLRAPIARVWQAIASAKEFGCWFGVHLDGDFMAGNTIRGTFGGDINEAAIREYQKSLGISPSGVRMPEKNAVFCTVERIEPKHHFSFRWIPYGVDIEADPENEPMTLVEFHLEETNEGTLLRIVESGFDRVPRHRRERAFRMNDGGWAAQIENIKKYVEKK